MTYSEEKQVCTKCGQRILTRRGVQLSPKLADIFDAIEQGFPKEEIAVMFWGDNSRKCLKALATSVFHINSAFEWMESEVRIRGARGEPYRVVMTGASPIEWS